MQTAARRNALWKGPSSVRGPARCRDSQRKSAHTFHCGCVPCDPARDLQRCVPGVLMRSPTVKDMPSTSTVSGSSLPCGGVLKVKRRTLLVSTYQTWSAGTCDLSVRSSLKNVGSSPQVALAAVPAHAQRRTKSFPGREASTSCRTLRLPLVPKLLTTGTVNSNSDGSSGRGHWAISPCAGLRCSPRKPATSGMFCTNQWPTPGNSLVCAAFSEPLKESTSLAM
mmetsp:Transcript_35264/g.95607  ORF Transcript_35264/g.95607 Transcript_35264/m.95607 type:complete len:224 (+) Transcript_35264:836-1507(+)